MWVSLAICSQYIWFEELLTAMWMKVIVHQPQGLVGTIQGGQTQAMWYHLKAISIYITETNYAVSK